VLNTAFSPWPSFTSEEMDAVHRVLASNRVNYWTGEEGRLFEREFAAWTGAKHAIALANGTVALDLALHALGSGPGDEVIVTPRTFIASVSCVINAGATPVFADVDRASGNLSADTIASVLTPRTRAVIVVHLAGWPCDMAPIMELADRHGFKVIEDCAQAHGARYEGRSVGTIGHIGAWSFCQDKIMTTGGEGGMVTTNDDELWSRMWSFKDHGKSWAAVYASEPTRGFRWVHESFGTNWRMLEMQAAIGRIQLKRLQKWIAARRENADVIGAALAGWTDSAGPLRVPRFPDQNNAKSERVSRHAYYKFYTYVDPRRLREDWSRDRIVAEINRRGVPCYHGSCSEVYLEKAFDRTPWRPRERLPNARDLGETSLMFLVHPTLTGDEVGRTAEVAAEVIRSAYS
jgi:dTDP-4-amino-4,6-dideoxygalactose transaminase